MSTTSQFFSGGSTVKSIQRGTITISGTATSATATITSVDTTKAFMRYLGSTTSADSGGSLGRAELTNATTVTATRGANTSSTSIISWELTEFN